MKPKLIILQTVLPDYRKAFFNVLRKELQQRLMVYGGATYFDSSIVTDQDISFQKVENNFFLGRRFLWQKGVRKLAKSNAVLIIELNPWILSNWFLLLSRKRKKLTTILWGHAWSRKGRESKTEFLRHRMRTLATAIITYTEDQKRELQLKMPDMDIVAAPNALVSASDMKAVTARPEHLVYVGRLTASKKPLFLIKAFEQSLDVIPDTAVLKIIGDGPEMKALKRYVKNHNLDKRVKILGRISKTENLKEIYANTLVSLCAGEVGLFLTQSLGFGVPMIVSKDENHGPEFSAALVGENILVFKTDDTASFRNAIKELYKNKDSWIAKRPTIAKNCANNFSVEAMAQTFINLVATYET